MSLNLIQLFMCLSERSYTRFKRKKAVKRIFSPIFYLKNSI